MFSANRIFNITSLLVTALFAFNFMFPPTTYALQGWTCCDNTGIADFNHCDACGPEMRKSYDDGYGCGNNTNCKKCGEARPRAITCSYGPADTPKPTQQPTVKPTPTQKPTVKPTPTQKPTPTPSPLSCNVELSKKDISLYPFGKSQQTATVTAKRGTKNVAITSAKVDFSLGGAALGSLSPNSDSSRPYQTIITAGRVGAIGTFKAVANVKANNQSASCSADTKINVKNLACESTAKCTPGSGGLFSGQNINCSMTPVKGMTPEGVTVDYMGKCTRRLSTAIEKFDLSPVTKGSPAFRSFKLRTGSYHCEFTYCLNSGSQRVCAPWVPGSN